MTNGRDRIRARETIRVLEGAISWLELENMPVAADGVCKVLVQVEQEYAARLADSGFIGTTDQYLREPGR